MLLVKMSQAIFILNLKIMVLLLAKSTNLVLNILIKERLDDECGAFHMYNFVLKIVIISR